MSDKIVNESVAGKIAFTSEKGYHSNGLENPLIIKEENNPKKKEGVSSKFLNNRPTMNKGDYDDETSKLFELNGDICEDSIMLKIEEGGGNQNKLDDIIKINGIIEKDKNFNSVWTTNNSNKQIKVPMRKRETFLYDKLPVNLKGTSLNEIFESKFIKDKNRRYTRNNIEKGKTFFKLRYIKEKFEELMSINNKDIYSTEVNNQIANNPKITDEENKLNNYGSNSISINLILNEDKNAIKFNSLFLQKLERGIFSFNLKKYEDSYNYLLGSGIVKDEYEFGELLLVIAGFDKYIVGDFVSKEKYPNKEKKVLQGFVKSMDFRKLKFLDSLRYLLSRLNLPKDAGLILEIVDVFSTVFYDDNKEQGHFRDTTSIYLLASSVLALNTMFSRPDIQNMKVMKKEDFVRMNKDVLKEVLENIYDELKMNKLDIIHDYNELIYRRLSLKAQSHHDFIEKMNKASENIKDPNLLQVYESNNSNDIKGEEILRMLKHGEIFIKYGNFGDPHPRIVKLSEDEKRLIWHSTGSCTFFKKNKFVEISDIKDVYIGASASKIFEKYNIPPDFDSNCFSIMAGKRSLDLRKDDENICKKWYQGIKFILRRNKCKMDLKNNKNNLKDSLNKKEIISDIWKTEILPNWHIYRKFVLAKEKGNLIEGYNSLNINNKDMNKKNREKFWKFLYRLNAKQSEKILDDKDKSEFLYLWTHGIPDWLRKKLWSIVLGNESGITENLFNFHLKQIEPINFKDILKYLEANYPTNQNEIAETYLSNGNMNINNKNNQIFSNYNTISATNFNTFRLKTKLKLSDDPILDEIVNDIIKITKRLSNEIIEDGCELNVFMDDLFKIVRVFTLFRPDITYSKQISYLSAILLLNSDNYYSAFVCFVNFSIPGFIMKFLTRDEIYVHIILIIYNTDTNKIRLL